MKVAVVGNGRTVHALVRGAAMAALGHDVRLVTLGPVLPVTGIEVKTRPIPVTLRESVAAARSFLADLRSFAPDLLHVHYAGGKLGTMASLSGVRPMVVSVMGGDVQPEQHPGGLPLLERRATRRLLQEADLILAKSDRLRAEMAALGDFGGKTETIRWGVDPEVFQPRPEAARELRGRLRLAPEARVILSPRILRPLYNVHLIVEALPRVLASVPEAVLLVAEHRSDPAYKEALADRAAALGVTERVRFIGASDHAQMPALYSLAEAMVSVPFSDGLPQSLFEAMACGTPTILGRLPGYAEVVTEGRHVVLTDLQPPALADAMVLLLRDRERAQAMASAARARVREVAWLPDEAKRVDSLYRRLHERPRRRASLSGRLLDGLSLFLR
jgi:glycosyltransferase involved in cell wall biosynthesis